MTILSRLFITLFAILFAMTLYAQDTHPKVSTLEIGSPAPDFDLPGVDGKNHTLAEYADSDVLVILFSCNHCPTAQAYEDRAIQFADDYKAKSVQMVAISPNSPGGLSLSELGYSDLGDDLADMKIRSEYKEYNFPYLYDGDDQKVSIAYGPVATPHVFVFNKKRDLAYVGRLDDSEKPGTGNAEDLRLAVDELLAGKELTQPKTKTFGCSTKWAWKSEWNAKLLADWAKLPVEMTAVNEQEIRDLVKNESSGKLRLINVWATWCGPCVAEFPSLVDIDRMYRGRDFEFVTISADSPKHEAQALKLLTKWQASNTNYVSHVEKRSEFIEAVDPEWQGALPYTILVEPGGKVVYRAEGMIDPLALKRAIVDHEMMGRVY